ncbi:uncharacterized protein KY384_007413 [Bacidia gigantensis]|uniref:uncharacterized protein n=1 Tax=Bacidia gigantensis TaxID=2732470 RepID=UPI001D045C57|nr:uncharacterized protein KY384_007413 [Bacidia gigantensis]KAG8528495.1 hypothetical protein KY384_007413 [Bacidia gigantensis]
MPTDIEQLDESSVSITSTSLRAALSLSVADRRWIDFLTQTVIDSWDEAYPDRPSTMGYMGSEDFIRLQFEEYLLALLSAVKYHQYLQKPESPPMRGIEGDPTTDFGLDWIEAWKKTPNFSLFNKTTDSHLFDIVEPRHPTAGNLTIEDVQRRVNQHIQTLHLDERFSTGKEALNKHLAVGQQRFSTAFASLQANIEAKRDAYRQRQAEAQSSAAASRDASPAPSKASAASSRLAGRAPDLSTAQASVQVAGQRAGAYISSWGAWASERRKGWGQKSSDGGDENSAPSERKRSSSPSPSKLTRWSSKRSSKSSTGKNGKEEKGEDGIGRLDA